MTGVRWWLNTDHETFSVDNASVGGIDCSSLDPDIWMVQWTDGKGELERQVDADTNDNGLREQFIDVIPYAPFFQQFLALCPRLTLTQAKKVDVDLIRTIFESKRQAPFHYPVAAGDYWWDATDATLFSSTAAGLQNAIASINAIVARLNSIVPGFNAVDGSIVSQVNSNVVAPGDALTNVHNGVLDAINAGIYSPLYYLVEHINNTLVGAIDFDHQEYNTINNRLQNRADHGGDMLGLNASLALFPNSVAGMPAYYGPDFVPITDPGPIAWTPLANVAVANASWIPIGATAPVNVTPGEQAAIMSGIAARTADLNVKQNVKIGQVNALTVIQDVVDYDVTTGW